MLDEDIIRALDKMICDREELLRHVANSAIREEVDALRALYANYCSMLDLESEYKIVQKKYKHREDEVNKLHCELALLHKELDEAKKPKRYYEVLFSDGSAPVRVENGASHYWTEKQLVIHGKNGKLVAAFNDEHVVGIIKRGEWEKDED
nr:MAG TPA: hypothetical protein [Caudoviricetes sp.]